MIAKNILEVHERIRKAALQKGRNPEHIKLVAVSKTVSVSGIQEAVNAGITILGENRVQEAETKIPAVAGNVAWHLIGHLQRNKVKKAVALFQCIHSVDSERLAIEIDKQAGITGHVFPVLVQVNVSGEQSKFGVSGETSLDLFRKIDALPNLKITGLMTIPPFFDDPEMSRPYYIRLRELLHQFKKHARDPGSLTELSMGMTNDFEIAVQEGATYVRVGTAVFGKRDHD